MDRKHKILGKLGQVCARIEDLLAGQAVTLADLPLPGDGEPGETDLERLQRFKALLGEALAELARGEARACRRCGEPLPDAELAPLPWATTHRACPSE